MPKPYLPASKNYYIYFYTKKEGGAWNIAALYIHPVQFRKLLASSKPKAKADFNGSATIMLHGGELAFHSILFSNGVVYDSYFADFIQIDDNEIKRNRITYNHLRNKFTKEHKLA